MGNTFSTPSPPPPMGDTSPPSSPPPKHEEESFFSTFLHNLSLLPTWAKSFATPPFLLFSGASLLLFYLLRGASEHYITWETVSFSTFLDQLKSGGVSGVFYGNKGDLFFTDLEGRRFSTLLIPGSAEWLFERIAKSSSNALVVDSAASNFMSNLWVKRGDISSVCVGGGGGSLWRDCVLYPLMSVGQMQLEDLLLTMCLGVVLVPLIKHFWGVSEEASMELTEKSRLEGKVVTFADVAGLDLQKEEIGQIIHFMRHPEQFADIGVRLPRGILLVGPPGTGKTLFARAIAGEANLPFFYTSGSAFVKLYVGQGALKVRQIFKEARSSAPSLLFIDELDAIGADRNTLGLDSHEYVHAMNQLLSEMDGVDSSLEGAGGGVIVIAASNREKALDEALKRAGRFDRVINIGLPNLEERREICRLHSRKKKLSRDVTLEYLALITEGMSGAEIENLLNEAALLAAREKTSIQPHHIEAKCVEIIRRHT